MLHSIYFQKEPLYRDMQTANKGQPDKPAVGVTIEDKINIPQIVCTFRNEHRQLRHRLLLLI